MNTSFVQGGHQGGAYVGQVNGENVSVSDCRGRKKALFIGINYFGSGSELRGCINDVHNVKNFVFSRYGFSEQNSVILTDDQQDPSKIPTRDNIIRGLRWLVEGASMGDSLFLHFSGHGGSIKDEDGDEVDGHDETIYPVDHERAGVIVDDEIHAICVKNLPSGVRLTAIFDCCHSGTVMDLPFTYKCDGEIEVICEDHRKEAAMALLKAGLSYSRGDKMGALGLVKEGVSFLFKPPANAEAQKKAEQEKKSNADVIQFSGCRDSQTSADAIIDSKATGAMSHALITALSQNSNLTYTQLLQQLRDILKGKYSQIPQMSTGRPMDMNTLFTM
ncbi:metacaspase [Basidiobolus meristosporus CBS 931.73]|uniref:Metacaspase n=1 Tax=Basidiobolus meristosporus CBS 931.73 TaxID=1314790 RepID=A0A1Y1Y4H2_9FUNG|nr:metacaspase [Basidiobolus meristosporus CBS 931.73]|eukprot:ORX92922.1 metacaspase [Basidiobolus meristosporus CBS 931.73]